MAFTLTFLKVFVTGIFYVSPILIFLAIFISTMGLLVGRREGWSRADSLYYAFITATTVGYGDFHPKTARSKYIAIKIALTGVVFTGIIVAVGLSAVDAAFVEVHGITPGSR